MKFFVTSDIHGFFDEFKLALDQAGFDPNNENHWLITCGDHFDRGSQAVELMEYLNNLHRKILIRGNHEELLIDCCNRKAPYYSDYSNGTYGTVIQFGKINEGNSFSKCCEITLNKIQPFIDQMVNYFETQNHIFVHSFVPTLFRKNWRKATDGEWKAAMWGNPFEKIKLGYPLEKKLVFGHWHCSAGWAEADGVSEFGEDAKFEPYYGDGYIAIDACTAHTRKCNVVVIEDEFLEKV